MRRARANRRQAYRPFHLVRDRLPPIVVWSRATKGGAMLRVLLPSLFLLASSAYALDITTCGQTVPSFDVGVLQTDLVCPNPNTGEGCLAGGMGDPAAIDLQ